MASVIVEVGEGKLKGCVKHNRNGEGFYSFLGIPYGRPMTGELRFQDPLPAEAWNGIKDATKAGEVCFQNDMMLKKFTGSEDCLSLNVFTKYVRAEKKLSRPVMFYIHGGAFMMGGSDPERMYDPSYFMTEDIVFVSINYRVGILGFLNLDDTSLNVPGNAGLKDQTLALKWVQKNIHVFNGDPKNVTIFGISAGSASVHYHILSKSSKGLFRRAIMQSGSALNPWAYGDAVGSHRVVKLLGKDAKTDREVLDILRNASVEELVEAQDKYVKEKGSILRVFGPVVEKPNPNAFLTQTAIDIITSGDYNKVPLILGYASNEGLLTAFEKKMIQCPEKKENLEAHLPPEANIQKDSPAAKAILEKIERFYHNEENIKNDYLLATDSLFVAGIIGAATNHVRTSETPVYLYRMSLDAKLNFVKNMMGATDAPGASHGDEIGYMFKNNMIPIEINAESIEDITITRFIKLWTQFAIFGEPTPPQEELDIEEIFVEELDVIWKPFDEKHSYFLDIDRELTLNTDPESERMKLWKEIYGLSPKTAKYL